MSRLFRNKSQLAMQVSFKIMKNTLKCITCFFAIFIFYQYQSYSKKQPQWRFYYNNASHIKSKSTIRAEFKYILIWNQGSFDFLKRGQRVFIENNCAYNNCYVTTHRNMINNDYVNFHAILFNGKKLAKVYVDGYLKLPTRRQRNQTYIFAMQEDSVTYPICEEKFDNFFNLTWSYKLDSDIVWPHFNILKLGTNEVFAPNMNVQWPTKYENIRLFEAEEKITNKEYFAVWNYTQCETQSVTQDVGRKIKMHSQDHDNIVDIIGPCGFKECTYESKEDCLNILDAYNFYLALEVVEAEDYVTTEVLDAMEHYCIPVVFGGANYSRFLPPNSYIDIKKLGTKETARLMDYLITDIVEYLKYFEWRTTFKIDRKSTHRAVCALCRAMNQGGERVQRDLRPWWNPDYKDACNTKRKRNAVVKEPDGVDLVLHYDDIDIY